MNVSRLWVWLAIGAAITALAVSFLGPLLVREEAQRARAAETQERLLSAHNDCVRDKGIWGTLDALTLAAILVVKEGGVTPQEAQFVKVFQDNRDKIIGPGLNRVCPPIEE